MVNYTSNNIKVKQKGKGWVFSRRDSQSYILYIYNIVDNIVHTQSAADAPSTRAGPSAEWHPRTQNGQTAAHLPRAGWHCHGLLALTLPLAPSPWTDPGAHLSKKVMASVMNSKQMGSPLWPKDVFLSTKPPLVKTVETKLYEKYTNQTRALPRSPPHAVPFQISSSLAGVSSTLPWGWLFCNWGWNFRHRGACTHDREQAHWMSKG